MSNVNSYADLIKEVRHRYELKYGTKLDDEIIYLIIRINELELGLKTELNDLKSIIANQSKIQPHIIKTVEKSQGKSPTGFYILMAIQFIMLLIMIFN